MSNNITRDVVKVGPAGDSTAGPKTLSEITLMNPTVMNYLFPDSELPLNQPIEERLSPPVQNGERKTTDKPNAEELTRQLQATCKKRTLITTEDTINSLMKENFSLKLALYNMKKASREEILGTNIENYEKDLLNKYMDLYQNLKKEIEEKNKKEEERKSRRRSIKCQTNLDNINMEELMKARVALKHQQSMVSRGRQLITETHQPTPKQPRYDKPPHHQVVTQLTYPSVSLPKPSVTTTGKQMAPDEKDLLEQLYIVHGNLTTVKDKMLAKVDMNE